MFRTHSLLYSAMLDLYWKAFETYLVEHHTNLDAIFELGSSLADIAKALKEENLHLITSSFEKALHSLQTMLDQFRKCPFCTTPTA